MWIRLVNGTMVNLSQAKSLQLDPCEDTELAPGQYALNCIFDIREDGGTVSMCIGLGSHPDMSARMKQLANALVVQSLD